MGEKQIRPYTFHCFMDLCFMDKVKCVINSSLNYGINNIFVICIIIVPDQ